MEIDLYRSPMSRAARRPFGACDLTWAVNWGKGPEATMHGQPANIHNMVDPLAMTIATNVAAKIADTLTDQAQQAITAIIRKLRGKFQSRGGGEILTLDAAEVTGDAPAVEALTRTLEQLFAAEPSFRKEIRALWDSAGIDQGVTNVFHGKADKVIMMRDVKGDLTIN